MNKYLEKLASRLSAAAKSWVRTEAKTAVPAITESASRLKNGKLQSVKSNIVSEARKKWSFGKSNPQHPSSETYRASAVLDRVITKSMK